MRLPNQSPPVSRNSDRRTHDRTTGSGDEIPGGLRYGQSQGINPSDYEDCYKLRGLAQQMCLNYY